MRKVDDGLCGWATTIAAPESRATSIAAVGPSSIETTSCKPSATDDTIDLVDRALSTAVRD